MKKLKLRIKDNKLFYFKNKQVRSPVVLDIYDKEIPNILTSLKMEGITDYIIEEENFKKEEKQNITACKLEPSKEVVIEELENIYKEEPKTILERLIRNGEISK